MHSAGAKHKMLHTHTHKEEGTAAPPGLACTFLCFYSGTTCLFLGQRTAQNRIRR